MKELEEEKPFRMRKLDPPRGGRGVFIGKKETKGAGSCSLLRLGWPNFLPGNKVYGEKLRLPVEAPPLWTNGRSHWTQRIPSFACMGSAVLRPGQLAPVLGSLVPRVPG